MAGDINVRTNNGITYFIFTYKTNNLNTYNNRYNLNILSQNKKI